MKHSLANDLRKARESVGLTLQQLAERLGKSVTVVSEAESGLRITEGYVGKVLKACGLPEDWNGNDAR